MLNAKNLFEYIVNTRYRLWQSNYHVGNPWFIYENMSEEGDGTRRQYGPYFEREKAVIELEALRADCLKLLKENISVCQMLVPKREPVPDVRPEKKRVQRRGSRKDSVPKTRVGPSAPSAPADNGGLPAGYQDHTVVGPATQEPLDAPVLEERG